MFRGQNNQFDEAVVKATDENLTSENWSYILDVCDRVSASPTGPQSVTAALIKRLAHRNANVQLYTLELANALSQNCGPGLHRELASRSFTDALVRLANDRNTHQQVKTKVLERMEGWTELFKGNADLGIMEQAYDKLRRGNPGLAPPSKPVKKEIEDVDRRKEEEELQMALALSLREKTASPSKPAAQPGTTQAESQPPPQAGTTAATVSRVRALYDFAPSETGELAFRQGDVIAVLESVYKDWWKGSLRGQTGIFPLNYVEKLQDPSKEELEHDAEMEGEVFAQIRNVEKLLALLSVRGEGGMSTGRDAGSEEEITELYHQTLAIRPKLIELIGKYSQKKDDFTQLNEKFIKARRDYEALLESSMSQPPAGYPPRHNQPYYNAYGRPPQGYPPQQPQHSSYPPQGPPQGPQDGIGGPPSGGAPSDHQRYYNQPPQQGPPATSNGYPYPASMNGPTNQNGPAANPAPFHFIPGGAPQHDVRRHSPKPISSGGISAVDAPFSPQQAQPFNDRPQSIHTLNSGNPQELGTGGYESPIDNRKSYPPAQSLPPQQHQYPDSNASAYPPQSGPPSQYGQPQQYPPTNLPIRQRTQSFEAPPGYEQQDGPYPHLQQQQQQQPLQPAPTQSYPPQAQHGHPPYQGPGSPPPPQSQDPYPVLNSGPPGGQNYQAYNPQAQGQQPVAGGGSSQWGGSERGDGDVSDYYR